MSTEQELDAIFEQSANAESEEQPAQPADSAARDEPAATETTAETQADKPAEQEAPKEPVDELAGLPPKVRAMLEKFEGIERIAGLVPQLQDRLRKSEGRIGDLLSKIPPPEPKRLEKVEAVRADLPEVIDAMEELIAARRPETQKQEQKPETQTDDEVVQTPTLDTERPDWWQELRSPTFHAWLGQQPTEYQQKVKGTSNEGVVLAALTKFDAHKVLAAEREAAAKRVSEQRETRARAAAAPPGAGRRAPTPASTLDDEFERGFRA